MTWIEENYYWDINEENQIKIFEIDDFQQILTGILISDKYIEM